MDILTSLITTVEIVGAALTAAIAVYDSEKLWQHEMDPANTEEYFKRCCRLQAQALMAMFVAGCMREDVPYMLGLMWHAGRYIRRRVTLADVLVMVDGVFVRVDVGGR